MAALPAEEILDPGELEYEIWDGEIVVKGQASRWHEAVRAKLISQLDRQLPAHLSVLVSSAVGDEQTAPRSDGSVVAPGSDPPRTLVWIEVVSPADLRRGDARLVGERRKRFLFDHGVEHLWVISDALGTVTLTAHTAERPAQAFASATTVPLLIRDAETEHQVALDLGALEDAARLAGDA